MKPGERQALVQEAIKFIGFCSTDGLMLGDSFLEQAELQAPLLYALKDRHKASMADKANRDLGYEVIDLRRALCASLQAVVDERLVQPFRAAARKDDSLKDDLDAAADSVDIVLGGTSALLEGEPPPSALAHGATALRRFLVSDKVPGVELLDRTAATGVETARALLSEFPARLRALADVLDAEDVEGARAKLDEIEVLLRTASEPMGPSQ